MSQFLEYIKMALFNILSNKVRSLLTMLGIVIGISSVILIMALGNGAKESITEQLSTVGNGQVMILSMGNERITIEDLEYIQTHVEGVQAYLVTSMSDGTITTPKGSFTGYAYGCNENNYLFEQYSTLSNGHYFTKEDYDMGRMVCYLAEDDAIKLFGNTDVIGMPIDIEIHGKILSYTIVGLTSYINESNAISYDYENAPIYLNVPLSTLNQKLGLDAVQIQGYTDATLMLASDIDTQDTCNQIIRILESRHDCLGEDQFMFQSFNDILATINIVINMITLFIALVAAISLFVGGIGVMNIMLVSVTERTREIGIRKALGAKTRSIMLQFLLESGFITMVGGILGILIGLGGAYALSTIISMAMPDYAFTPSISLTVILITTLFSSTVGLFFGIYPARKAAKLSPIEALRRM